MTDHQKALKEFIETFEASKDPALWDKLVREEAQEVTEALENLLKEITDLVYVLEGYAYVTNGCVPDHEDPPGSEIHHDIVCAIAHAVDEDVLKACFEEVHRSNMSKLGEDGKPIRREDGKILKGPNYSPADIGRVLKEISDASD